MSGSISRWLWGLAVSICSLVSAHQAFAQQVPQPESERYTLAQLVGLAVQNTQLLGSQDARIEETRLAARQARVWPGMSVDFLTGRKREADLSGSRYELALAQPLPLTGKPGLRGELLDLESESWSVRRSASEVLVTLNVVQLAYEYAASRRKAAFVESRQKRFDLIREFLAGRPFATPQRKAESRIVQNRLKLLVSEAIQSQAGFKSSFEKLKVYIPLAPGKYPEVEVPWLSGAKSLDEKEWAARALDNNPDLRVQRLTVKSAELEKTLARRDGLPDPALVTSYDQAKAGDTEKNYGLGLSLALPSWNRNRSGIKSAEQRRLAEERLLAFEEQKLKAEFPRALVEYEAARQVALKYPQTILPDLEAQLKEAEEGFRKGQLDLLTFLELDSSAAETYGRVLDAQVELTAKLAEIFTSTQERDAVTLLGSY
ncbi:MAG: TolC family protein [Elusimicrobia bacterium]|nr:TolC family protein [Elusimicrobiota bacterium]